LFSIFLIAHTGSGGRQSQDPTAPVLVGLNQVASHNIRSHPEVVALSVMGSNTTTKSCRFSRFESWPNINASIWFLHVKCLTYLSPPYFLTRKLKWFLSWPR